MCKELDETPWWSSRLLHQISASYWYGIKMAISWLLSDCCFNSMLVLGIQVRESKMGDDHQRCQEGTDIWTSSQASFGLAFQPIWWIVLRRQLMLFIEFLCEGIFAFLGLYLLEFTASSLFLGKQMQTVLRKRREEYGCSASRANCGMKSVSEPLAMRKSFRPGTWRWKAHCVFICFQQPSQRSNKDHLSASHIHLMPLSTHNMPSVEELASEAGS